MSLKKKKAIELLLLDAKEKAIMLCLCALLFVDLHSISKDGHEPYLLLLKKQDTAGWYLP